MSTALKLSDELIDLAKPHAVARHGSVPKQIEYRAPPGKAVEDDPERPIKFIKESLPAVAEANTGQC